MKASVFIDLLKRVHNGDIYGIEPIYLEYYEKMKYTARRMLYDDRGRFDYIQDAEDAVAEVFKNLIAFAESNDMETAEIGNANAYIYKTLKNAALKIAIERSKTVSMDYIETLLVDKETYKRANLKLDIFRFMKTLPETQQEVLILHYFYGFKLREVASRTDIPSGTVKWHISEIKRKLRAYLDK